MLTDHDHCADEEEEEEVSSIKVVLAVSNALPGVVLARSINLFVVCLSLVIDYRIPSL